MCGSTILVSLIHCFMGSFVMGRLEPFGAYAIRKGYATHREVQEGIAAMTEAERQGKPRPLLGVVLLQMGVLTTDQMIEILREMEQGQARSGAH